MSEVILDNTGIVLAGVLIVLFSRAEKRVERITLGMVIVGVAGTIVVDLLPDVPGVVDLAVAVGAFLLSVLAALVLLHDRSRNGHHSLPW